MRLHPDQRHPEQIVHGLGNLPEPVKQFLLHIFTFRLGFNACHPFINIQLLVFIHNIRRRNIGIHIQLYGRIKSLFHIFSLQPAHRLVEHLTIKVISYRRHMPVLLFSEKVARATDLQIPHGDLETAP